MLCDYYFIVPALDTLSMMDCTCCKKSRICVYQKMRCTCSDYLFTILVMNYPGENLWKREKGGSNMQKLHLSKFQDLYVWNESEKFWPTPRKRGKSVGVLGARKTLNLFMVEDMGFDERTFGLRSQITGSLFSTQLAAPI